MAETGEKARQPKHLVIDEAINIIEKAISRLEDLSAEINGEDRTAKIPMPSGEIAPIGGRLNSALVEFLNGTPERLGKISDRIKIATENIKTAVI